MKELKALLKPPFINSTRGVVYDQDGNAFASCRMPIALEFLLDALNNEWEREYGEPKRWNFNGRHLYHCPVCGNAMVIQNDLNYCPSCGQRLLPPEEKDASSR